MKRLALFALVGALLVGALLFGGWLTRRAGSLEEARWARVERGPLELGVEVEGVLKAGQATVLGPPLVAGMWDFKIAFLAPEGSEVEAGTPVLGFDSSQLARQLEDRASQGQQADTELEQRQAQWERRQQELKLKLAEVEAKARKLKLATAVPAELEAAKEADEKQVDQGLAEREVELVRRQAASEERRALAELSSLAGRRDRARARVAELERDLGRLTVVAPRRGTVLYNQDEGERPKVGDSVWQGRTVVSIPDLGTLEGEGEVDETDFSALALGQKARLILDAFPDAPLEGTVTAIGSNLRWRDEGVPVKVVQVRLALAAGSGGRARPGMRFRGLVITERVENVLLLPLEAVRASPAGLPPGLTVLRRRFLGTEPVAVTVGRRVGGKVEMLTGLAVGDLAVGDEVQLP